MEQNIINKRLNEAKIQFKMYWEALSNLPQEQISSLLDYLKESDYFTAPASTRFHLNYTSGLLEHSVHVAKNLLAITNKFDIKWERPESPYIIGLFHDLCKTNYYKAVVKNVKNEVTGKWEKVPGFEVDDKCPLGHGEKSVVLLQQHLKLTMQEIFCIRYHMHVFDTSPGEQRNFSAAVSKYPEILFTCMADHLAGTMESWPEGIELPFSI